MAEDVLRLGRPGMLGAEHTPQHGDRLRPERVRFGETAQLWEETRDEFWWGYPEVEEPDPVTAQAEPCRRLTRPPGPGR